MRFRLQITITFNIKISVYAKHDGCIPPDCFIYLQMEEVKEAPVQSTVSAPQTVVSSGMSEFHGLNGATKFGVGVPRNPPVPSLAATAPLTSTSPATLKPPGSSPVKPVANSTVIPQLHTAPSNLKLDKNVSGSLNLARNGGISLSSCSQYLLFIYLFAFWVKVGTSYFSLLYVNKMPTWAC